MVMFWRAWLREGGMKRGERREKRGFWGEAGTKRLQLIQSIYRFSAGEDYNVGDQGRGNVG